MSSLCDVIRNGFDEAPRGLTSSSCDVIRNGFVETRKGLTSSLRDVIRNGFAGVDRGFGDGGFGVRRALFFASADRMCAGARSGPTRQIALQPLFWKAI